MKKPLVAYIIRNSDFSVLHLFRIAHDVLESRGYEVITGHSLDDIPDDRIGDLDLLIVHLRDKRRETSNLVEQAKLSKLSRVKPDFKFAVRLNFTERDEGCDDFGKVGESYYMLSRADIVDAVEYFLRDGK